MDVRDAHAGLAEPERSRGPRISLLGGFGPEPAPEVLGVAEEPPRTGPEDLWLAGFALMLLGAGLLTIARGKTMDAMAAASGTSWTNHTA